MEGEPVPTNSRSRVYLLSGSRHQQEEWALSHLLLILLLFALLPGGSNKGKELIGLSAFLTIPHSRGESDYKELEHVVCVCVCVCMCVCMCVCACAHMHVCTQSFSILCDPMDCSPPGSSVHVILQARILEWVAISSFRRSS